MAMGSSVTMRSGQRPRDDGALALSPAQLVRVLVVEDGGRRQSHPLHHLQHAAVAVDRVVDVGGGVVVPAGLGEVALPQPHDRRQVRRLEVEEQVRVVGEEVGHAR